MRLMRGLYAHDRLPWRPRPARAALAGLLRDARRGRAWLIEAGGEPAGYLVVTLGWSLEYLGLDAFIDELYLVPAWRGRGVGSAAVRLAEAACRRLGVRALHLEVERRNRRARLFYRRAGFLDHDRFLMTRLLRPWRARGPSPARRARIAASRARGRSGGNTAA
jgi:ribosomal protein S18 acetylase RimI-like enzyme